MSNHLKRLVAPGSWHIPKKVQKFVMKTAPGPHNAGALPVGVWLREHIGLAGNASEVRKILHQRDVIVNGRACRNPQMGLGVLDIVSIPKLAKHYRIQLDKRGNLIAVDISAASAKTRLCKIRNKTTVRGGRVQLNLSLIHISEPTRLLSISYAVFCLKKKNKKQNIQKAKCNT